MCKITKCLLAFLIALISIGSIQSNPTPEEVEDNFFKKLIKQCKTVSDNENIEDIIKEQLSKEKFKSLENIEFDSEFKNFVNYISTEHTPNDLLENCNRNIEKFTNLIDMLRKTSQCFVEKEHKQMLSQSEGMLAFIQRACANNGEWATAFVTFNKRSCNAENEKKLEKCLEIENCDDCENMINLSEYDIHPWYPIPKRDCLNAQRKSCLGDVVRECSNLPHIFNEFLDMMAPIFTPVCPAKYYE